MMVNKRTELKIAIVCFILAALAALFIGCPIPPPPPPPPPPIEYVTVGICPASILLPNQYCPITENRQFIKGQEPTTQCGIHQAPPPPVEPDPQAPFSGTSFYQINTATPEDAEWFIVENHKAGGNATEAFFNYTWAGGWRYQPFLIIDFNWKDDAYPDANFPLFDLNQQSPEAWTRFRNIFNVCKRERTALFLRIHDFVSLKNSLEKRYYDFRSNKQRLVDGVFTGGIWGEPAKQYYRAQNAVLVEELKKSGVVFYLVIMNEADYLSDPGDSEDLKDQKVIDFHKFYIEDLVDRGVSKDRIVISTSRAYSKLKALGTIMEIHGINSPRALQEAHTSFGKDGMEFNGDGPDQYAEGRAGDRPEKREPSFSQGAAMGAYLKQFGLWTYLYFNRATEAGGGSSIKRAQFDIVKAIADTLRK
jgi:hypothetical protein